MNLLAHLHLAAAQPGGVAAGNLLADYRRHVAVPIGDRDVAEGIRFHRRIDAVADAHPRHRSARALISPRRRRLAGVIVDVLYDYCLSSQWASYASEPLEAFVERELNRILHALPPGAADCRALIARIRSERWILCYGTPAGLRLTFQRVARRSPVAAGLLGAEEELDRVGPHLAASFQELYDDLQAACHTGGVR